MTAVERVRGQTQGLSATNLHRFSDPEGIRIGQNSAERTLSRILPRCTPSPLVRSTACSQSLSLTPHLSVHSPSLPQTCHLAPTAAPFLSPAAACVVCCFLTQSPAEETSLPSGGSPRHCLSSSDFTHSLTAARPWTALIACFPVTG